MTSTPTPPQPSWRQVGRPIARRGGTGPLWRRESQGVSRRRRGIKAIGTSLIALAVIVSCGLLIWVCTWLRPPRPVRLVLIGAGYLENLAIPHNSYGIENLARLAELAAPGGSDRIWGSGMLHLKDGPRTLRADSAWDEGLGDIEEQTLVVVLALHGGTDGLGAYLLPDDAGASNTPSNRLRLDRVLDRFSRLPAGKNKVLILDATQVDAHWPLGMLHNDFAYQLEKLEPRIARIPNLVVLSASGVDQRSWSCDALRQTTFGYFLVEGLKGAAADENGRIDVEGLYRFVRGNVHQWAGSHLGQLQSPVLLPGGDLGRRRARRIELTIVDRPGDRGRPVLREPPSVAGPGPAWEKYRRLKGDSPAPQVYTPHLWRQYQDILVRYDQLVRAGAVDAAADLALRLDELARGIQQARYLELSSAQNTLAMQVVEGRAVPDAEAMQQVFDDLWGRSPRDAASRWQKLLKSAPNLGNASQARLQLYDLLVRRVEEGSSSDGVVNSAYELAQVLDDPVRPRPAEVHDVIMLHRDMPRDPPPPADYFDRVAQASSVRRMAESAALLPEDRTATSYAEQVYHWARAPMSEADRGRRRGQDLLFASDEPSWAKAGDLFRGADSNYQGARATASVVRDALAVRDHVLAALPYFSQWLVESDLTGDVPRSDDNTALSDEAAEKLWKETHELVRLLESAPVSGPSLSAEQFQALGLANLSSSVREAIRRLEDASLGYLDEIDDVDLPNLWYAARIALRMPLADPDLHAKLLANYMRIERQFVAEMQRESSDVVVPMISEATTQAEAKVRSRNQGRMALAVLGQRWFEECKGVNLESYTQVRGRLESLDIDPNWRESLTRAGDQVGYRWQQVPAEINRRLAGSLQAAPAQAEMDLRFADRLARMVDAAGSQELASNPTSALRNWLVRSLLLWQAQRTYDDRWYAEDPATEPYYRAAGRLYVDDAVRYGLVHDSAEEWHGRLAKPSGLRLTGPPSRVVTSERRIGVEYRLQPVPGSEVTPGDPVVWLHAKEDLRLLQPSSLQRLVRRVGGEADPPIECILDRPSPGSLGAGPSPSRGMERSTLAAHGLYRGQLFSFSTSFDIYPEPDIIVGRHPLPQFGSISVRAQKEVFDRFGNSDGAVAIVLDCSGSMGLSPGQSWGPTVKYQEATDALGRVLGKLSRGTMVSVWVFGEAIGREKTAPDPNQTIRRIRPSSPWDPAQFAPLMGRLRYPALEPWNESPIVRTMLMARDDLINQPGFKTLLVITDGRDNQFANDPIWNREKRSIPTALLENFAGTDIEINVVGYKVVSQEQEQARQQFQVIESLPQPGRFFTVMQAEDLADTLERALRKRLRSWVEGTDNVLAPGMPSAGLQISPDAAGDRWLPFGLAPGGYKLVLDAAGRLEKSIAFNRGDLLLVKLVETSREIVAERVVFSSADYGWKPAAEAKDWRLALLQNQRRPDGGLQMLATLEKSFDPRETSLQVIRPRDVWFELHPWPETRPPIALRWSNQSGYPAPAWSFDVPSWPAISGASSPSLPRLRAWWNPDQEPLPAGTLDRGPDFEIGSSGGIPPVRVDGADVLVEGVDIEDHLVETRDGVREKMPCLVVRLGHAPVGPVWVRPRGISPTGHEHHFYTEAGKYTGLFWPVTIDEAKSSLTGLSLVSLADFKARAERRGYMLDLRDLPPPDARDVRPRAIPSPRPPPLALPPALEAPADSLSTPLGALHRGASGRGRSPTSSY